MKLATLVGPLSIRMEMVGVAPTARLLQARPTLWRDVVPHNLGDWFINLATNKILDFDDLYLIRPEAETAAFDFVNENCDALILKGSNYFHRNGNLSRLLSDNVLSRLKIPMIMIGSGLQAGSMKEGELAPEDADVLRQLSDRCASISVRGYASAELLATHGIHNVSVTGCPTFFWQQQRELRIRRPEREHAVFTFFHGLLRDQPDRYRKQFEALELLRRRAEQVTVELQGEALLLQDLFMTEHWHVDAGHRIERTEVPGLSQQRRIPLDAEALRAEALRTYSEWASPTMIEWLSRSTFFSWDICDYLDLLGSAGLVAGTRLHGNLMALSNGTPTYFLTFDRRIEELAELMAVPRCALDKVTPDFDPFEADWAPVESAYRDLRNRMIRFLEVNRLRHRLGEVDPNIP
jgi:polysaccharide pyruvyl transferase WcaK-like protein